MHREKIHFMNNFYSRIRNTYEDNEDQTTSLNVAIHHLVHSIAAFSKEFKDSAISENISIQEFAATILRTQSMADSSGILYQFATESGMI